MIRIACTFGLLLLIADLGEPPSHFPFERSVLTKNAGESCAVLDPLIFAHAAESLSDLRLLRSDGSQVPYVLTLSETAAESVTIPVRHLVDNGNQLAFDLEMPPRPYTDVVLDLASTDFVATASVTGGDAASPGTTQLGQFALFDLSAQHLPRSTVLHLQETALPMLHVELRGAAGSRALRPEMVRGATVPPSREAQTLYTTAVQTTNVEQRGQETVAMLNVPPRVPIEQILISLAPDFHGDLNRAVRIQARGISGKGSGMTTNAGDAETLTGVIARLHLMRDGLLLTTNRMAVPATLGANLQTEATVEVAIKNGGATPLPVRFVELQTRERRICFNTSTGVAPLTLFYGDPHLHAPVYAEAPRLATNQVVQVANLGVEERNPMFVEQADRRPLLRRHPRLFSLSFLLLVCLCGVVALRSTRLRLH